MQRLDWLDELRGVAALAVMAGHYRVLLNDWDLNFPVLDVFARGVQLFYILSGYILFRLYYQKLEEPGGKSKFFIKRFFRIAPLYYFVTLVVFVLFFNKLDDPWSNVIAHFSILGFGFNPLWINGIIGVEWSIFVEFSFYLIFPLLLSWFNNNKNLALLLALVLSIAQTGFIYQAFTDIETKTYFYYMPTTQLCFFILGMWIANLHIENHLLTMAEKMALYGLCAILIVPLFIKSFTVQLYISFILLGMFTYGYPVIQRPKLLRIFLSYCGTRSYSIYLIHLPVLAYCHFLGKGVEVWLFLFIVVLILSEITYRIVEQNGIAMGGRLAER